MIICSCNIVSDKDIERAIEELFEVCSDIKKITSWGILKILWKKYDCFGCQPAFEKLVWEIEIKVREKIKNKTCNTIVLFEAAE